MSETAIVEHTGSAIAPSEWNMMRDQAAVLVKTGFLPKAITTPEQALAIALTGRELGLPMMQAMRGINVIQGVPTLKPELMLALCIQRIPGFTFKWGECDEKHATFICSRPGLSEAYVSVFTLADAQAAKLTGKDNWQNYAKNMLRCRALGNGLHATCPDVLVGLYTPEEMGATVNADGEVIELPDGPPPEPTNSEPNTVDAEVILTCIDCSKRIVDLIVGGVVKKSAADVAKLSCEETGADRCAKCYDAYKKAHKPGPESPNDLPLE